MIWKLREKVRKEAPKAVRKWFLQRASPLGFYQVSVQDGLFPFRMNTKQPLSFSFDIMAWSKMRTAYFQGCWADSCHQLSPPRLKRQNCHVKRPLPCLYLGNGRLSSISWAHSQCRSQSLQATLVSWICPCGFFLLEFGTKPNTLMIPRRTPPPPCVNENPLWEN